MFNRNKLPRGPPSLTAGSSPLANPASLPVPHQIVLASTLKGNPCGAISGMAFCPKG